jgi:hypothetical protein
VSSSGPRGSGEGGRTPRSSALSEVETTAVRSTLPDEASFRCIVECRGVCAYCDLLSGELNRGRDHELVKDHTEQEGDLPIVDRENDPPVVDVCS